MAPARTPARLVLGLSVAVAVLWAAGVAMAIVLLALYSEGGPWRAAGIAALVLIVAGFAALIAAILAAVRGRA